MAATNSQQLLDSSWTLHRLSPLHHEKEFQTLLDNPVALRTYAARLRDQLTGNAFAGLQGAGGGPEDDALSRTGALINCTWEMMPTLALLDLEGATTGSSNDYLKKSSGIMVVLEYETTVYKAALLAPPKDRLPRHKHADSTTNLPLLLTRLPNPLRQTFVTFLSANFDTYCSVLRLPSSFMCTCLETYITNLSSRADSAQNILEGIIKELQLTLAFSPPVSPALRTLNVNIPRTSLASFVEPDSSSTRPENESAVLSNLSSYLSKHLAMDLGFPGPVSSGAIPSKDYVRLSKIACGGFILGSEGRLKLVTYSKPRRPADDSVDDAQTETGRLGLRASEALLQSVLERTVSSDSEST